MIARAAVLYAVNKPVVVEDVEVLEPDPHEVLVKWMANGVCHSDLHVITGDYPHPLPVVLGHEAAGVVQRTGPGVESVTVRDHVCSSYFPSCGTCAYGIGGQPTMCALRDKPRCFMLDGTPRFRKDGQGLHHFLQVSGYATYSVLMEESVIPIRKDVVCLVSCGVLAGAGPVFKRARVPPGASVAAWGCGGVGLNTIQAARMVGSGQNHRGGRDEAEARLGRGVRRHPRRRRLAGGRGVACAGAERHRRRGLRLRGGGHAADHRAGVAVHPPGRHLRGGGLSPAGTRVSVDPMLLLQQRVLTGSSFGGRHQRTDVPMLIDLYMSGKYRLEELISRRLPLDDLNHAFDLMVQGEVKRSVVVYA